jgi:hypothetical protein
LDRTRSVDPKLEVSVNGEEISERGKPTTDGYTIDDIMRKFKSKYCEFLFVSLLFVTAVTVITSGQVALGQGESSPLKVIARYRSEGLGLS